MWVPFGDSCAISRLFLANALAVEGIPYFAFRTWQRLRTLRDTFAQFSVKVEIEEAKDILDTLTST